MEGFPLPPTRCSRMRVTLEMYATPQPMQIHLVLVDASPDLLGTLRATTKTNASSGVVSLLGSTSSGGCQPLQERQQQERECCGVSFTWTSSRPSAPRRSGGALPAVGAVLARLT